jgi:CHAT domain-containing protein
MNARDIKRKGISVFCSESLGTFEMGGLRKFIRKWIVLLTATVIALSCTTGKGLSRAFIHAGTPTVVASLWSVSDYSTVALMRFFFQNLKTLPKAEALRLAQLQLMKSRVALSIQRGTEKITLPAMSQPAMSIDCSHPYFWAPVIMLGDWR